MVCFIILINTLFTVACLYVFLRTGGEPTTLIGCWFAFTTGELWLMATIKKENISRKKILKDRYIRYQLRKKEEKNNEQY